MTMDDVIYRDTYDTVNQCIGQRTQESINKARTKIINMNQRASLKFAVGEFSKLVDNVQQELFEQFYSYLYDGNHRERDFIDQQDINIARNYILDFSTYKGNKDYISSWSSKLDQYQGKIIIRANDAVKKCKENCDKDNISEAEKWISQLVISNNKDCNNEALRLDNILNTIKSINIEDSVKPEVPVEPEIPVNPEKTEDKVQARSLIKKEIQEEKNIAGKTIYDSNQLKIAVRGALRNFEDKLKVHGANYVDSELNEVIGQALAESQEIIYGYNGASWSILDKGNGNSEIIINFEYLYDKAKLLAQRDAVTAKVNEIISKNIRDDMSKFEIELFLHDYLVDNAFYDEDYLRKGGYRAEEHSAYGILIEGNGVCEGYAKAMCVLCKEAGVECLYVPGYAGQPHGWNMVKLDDNKWYNLDVTWDDPVYSNGEHGFIKITHNYFNVPNGEFIKTHTAEGKIPVANGVKYLRDNVNIPEYDMDGKPINVITSMSQLKEEVNKAILNGHSYMACKFLNMTANAQQIADTVLELCQENNYYLKYGIQYDGTPIKYFTVKLTY